MKEEIKLNKKELEYQRKIADKYPELIGKKAAYRQDAEIDSRQTELDKYVRQLCGIVEPFMAENHMPLEYLARACEMVRTVFESEAVLPKATKREGAICNG